MNFDKFYDALEKCENEEGRFRRCPSCKETDCKYALHDKQYRGFDVSIACNDCRHSETAVGPDYDDIINNWHEAI